MIRGPGTNVWHMGLAKEFRVHRQEHPPALGTDRNEHLQPSQLGQSGRRLSSASSFGVITAVGVNNQSTGDINGVRVLRMGLRLKW